MFNVNLFSNVWIALVKSPVCLSVSGLWGCPGLSDPHSAHQRHHSWGGHGDFACTGLRRRHWGSHTQKGGPTNEKPVSVLRLTNGVCTFSVARILLFSLIPLRLTSRNKTLCKQFCSVTVWLILFIILLFYFIIYNNTYWTNNIIPVDDDPVTLSKDATIKAKLSVALMSVDHYVCIIMSYVSGNVGRETTD